MILREYEHKQKCTEESFTRSIVLYLSEYLDMLIKSADSPCKDMSGAERKIKALHDIITALSELNSP